MKHRTQFLVLTTLAGFLTLSCFAVIQRKIMGFVFTPDPRAFIVPLVYGGAIGLLLGLRHLRIRKDEAELRSLVEKLQVSEEALRCQVNEYMETHERLLASEYCLQEQNDELLATEEMLRVQIEEYEASRKLLQESNKSLQTIFDVSPLALAISSYPEGAIREINQKFSDDFGYLCSDVIGKNVSELGFWGSGDERERFLKLISCQQGISGFGTEVKTLHGVSLNVLIYSNFMEYKGERCLLLVYMDITEQKKMADILRQTQKMEVLGRLAGGVAHDFNNMLSAIMSSAELLTNYVKDAPKAMKFVATILEATNRSADLTRQLLAFSRKGQKTSVPVCINETIQAAITMLERTIDKNIALETRLVASDAVVIGDPALLQNAILNLGINARDAMREGGTITFATANVVLGADYCGSHGFKISEGPFVEISVSDSGMGMSREVVEHIFEPFFTTKEIGKGTGLGLAAVYGTIKQHHGCISVYSEANIGTVFKLYIPLAGCKNVIAPQEDKVVRGTGGILFVDDEALIRSSGKGLLEELGYRVYLAENGERALEVYARERGNISLVILDMVMPIMGGKETLLRLKARFPEVRVLISSGFSQEGIKEDFHTYGAHGFIQKPYRKVELCRAVALAIGDPQRVCE